jgi:hypothetical protein
MYVPKETVARINMALSHPDASWGYFRTLSDADAADLDRLLVAAEHPLAYQAGNRWQRFQSLHAAKHQF